MLNEIVFTSTNAVRRSRAANRALVDVRGTALADDVQDWIIWLIRSGTSGFSRRNSRELESLTEAADRLVSFVSLHPYVIAMGYDIEGCAAFLVEGQVLLAAIRKNNALFSVDGFIMVDPHVRSGCIVDYNGCEDGVSVDGVVLSYLGDAAV